MKTSLPALVPVLAAMVWAGCATDTPPAIRLVDVFQPEFVQGAPATADPEPRALWDFAAAKSGDPLLGWKAGRGIADLKVVNGKLTGRATTDFPILYAARPETADASDLFHSLVIRARASEDVELRAHLAGSQPPDFERLAEVGSFNWLMEGRLAGGQAQTVTLSQSNVVVLRAASTILLRPVEKAGQTFEIDSIQMVSQRENRASIPSGVGWQGLSEVFRETIVSRSPESFSLDLDIPPNAWLDLHVGTVEEAPLTFRIDDVTGAQARPLLERTVTTPQQWENAAFDLTGLTGSRKLRFSLDVDTERRIGFWGSPAIRVRDARPDAPEPASVALGGVEPPRNVIVLLLDTLRKDHLDAYGYERETAPHLARMAAGGALFLDNISQAAWTKVSVPSILTSLYPASHGVRDIPDRLPSSATTLAEVYRAAGYTTASLASNNFAGRFTNLHQGFEQVSEPGSFSGRMGSKTARPVIDKAVEFIEDHRDSPFFLYVHVLDPHSNFEPRAPYNTLWSDAAAKEPHENERKAALAAAKKNGHERQFNHLPFSGDLAQAGIAPGPWMDYEKGWYDGSIRGMDAEIGRLLERLRELHLEQDTMIAVIADHGEELHDHGKMGHGHVAYGEIANVPLILYRPGAIPAGVRVTETTRSIDLMPTLLDASGLAIPKQAQGRTLLPLVAAYRGKEGDAAKQAAAELGWEIKPAVLEEHKRKHPGQVTDDDDESYAIVFEGWKLIHNVQTKKKPEFELFDHAADPLDTNNLAEKSQDRVEALKTELAWWRRMVDDAKLSDDTSTDSMSSEEIQKLRSLGYIQ
jgi:arylsulfatase A-like enzyme